MWFKKMGEGSKMLYLLEKSSRPSKLTQAGLARLLRMPSNSLGQKNHLNPPTTATTVTMLLWRVDLAPPSSKNLTGSPALTNRLISARSGYSSGSLHLSSHQTLI